VIKDTGLPDSEEWSDVAGGDAIACERDRGARPLERADAEAHHWGFEAGAEIEWIPVAELVLSDSPRSAGEDWQHARVLAELESGAELPPIVVQRGSNRVIDGMHRVRAAQLRGEQIIRARFFDGDDGSAFVLAVRLNVQHGMPLSLADRKSAARRILREQVAWSNRAVASVVGLSPKTVAALRGEAGASGVPARIGRDGRVRPVDTASGRERAREILLRDPTSSLRSVSAVAGVSPGTVRAVRLALRGQAGAVVPEPRTAPPARNPDPPSARGAGSRHGGLDRRRVILHSLRSNPSLRFNESGRLLLSILAVAAMGEQAQECLITGLPDHCVDFVAELAEASAQAWRELATRLERRRSTAASA
jgi:hypothetical protein